MIKTFRTSIFCLLILLLSGFALAQNSAKGFAFALIGDLPYGVDIGEKSPQFDTLVDQINRDHSLKWVIHVGDIKKGNASCKDEFLLDRQQRFSRFTPAFILTPGDNEWTDCHRFKAGGFDPLERLEKLRALFFTPINSPLKHIASHYERQSDAGKDYAIFSENILWQYEDIVFTTVHMVGSDNGYNRFSIFSKAKRRDKHDKEIVLRTDAALSWVSRSFAHARQTQAKGLFISTHANPGLADYMDEEGKATFASFLNTIYRETASFNGQVVLAHGDSHNFRIDKPAVYQGKKLQNLTRIETFGALNGHWIRVDINPGSDRLFTFSPRENNQ